MIPDTLQTTTKKEGFGPLLIFNVFNDIRRSTFQKSAQLIYGIGGDTVALFDTVISRPAESCFLQSIGRNIFFFHSPKQRFIANHIFTPQRILDIISIVGKKLIEYVRIYEYNIKIKYFIKAVSNCLTIHLFRNKTDLENHVELATKIFYKDKTDSVFESSYN